MKEQLEKTIKEFLSDMAQQDNRATAFPYFYIIRDEDSVCVGRDSDDSQDTYCDEDYDEITYRDEDYDTLSEEEYDKLPEKERTKLYLKKVWVEKGMFLTEKDAKLHLKINHYHYTENAHTYVKHSWRAGDLKDFLKALFLYFNVEKGNLDF